MHQQSSTKEGTYDCLRPTSLHMGADLFELKGIKYLLVVDYFSRYVEIVKLTSIYSGAVIAHLKTFFITVWYS